MAEVKRPLEKGWIPLGANKGVSWALWNNSVTLQRREKQGEEWKTAEKFNANTATLKELAWRIPHWLKIMEAKRSKRESRS
jgi:hypothetical protein